MAPTRTLRTRNITITLTDEALDRFDRWRSGKPRGQALIELLDLAEGRPSGSMEEQLGQVLVTARGFRQWCHQFADEFKRDTVPSGPDSEFFYRGEDQ